ncbi:unnamed protein product [Darwinula stevensoni]|uniref:Uncharacterized protein n=1 Tax=Darwinula stevensoni TaxID=69355 RepID=A0A7R9A8G1_9CRUS|nr:unnamed protein product [Darwinula stevensoni]CAG0896388.1 unnamed protein product [Darwinula stevensoni]
MLSEKNKRRFDFVERVEEWRYGSLSIYERSSFIFRFATIAVHRDGHLGIRLVCEGMARRGEIIEGERLARRGATTRDASSEGLACLPPSLLRGLRRSGRHGVVRGRGGSRSARDYDVDRAEKMFRAHLEWREKWRPEYLRDEWKVPQVLERYGVFGFIGYDLEGSPVMVVDQGGMDLKGILSSASKEDYIQWVIRNVEECRQKMRLDPGNGPSSQFVIVFELNGWSFSNVFSKSVVEVGLALVQMQEANYPDHLKRIYLLNMPRFFTMALNMVKPFLRQATLDKIVCLGSKEQYEPVLTQAIPRVVLPKFWGGTRVDEDGDPKCSSLIGKGGKVPKSFYRTKNKENKTNEEEEEDSSGEMLVGTLKGGEALSLECRVSHPGSLLSWEFRTEGEGVEYSLLRLEDGEQADDQQGSVSSKQVRDWERVDSHQETVSGENLLQEPGLYCLQFQSQLDSDRLSYKVRVTIPNQL